MGYGQGGREGREKEHSQSFVAGEKTWEEKPLLKSEWTLQYLRIQLVVFSNSLAVRIFVSDATEAAQYALLQTNKQCTKRKCE